MVKKVKTLDAIRLLGISRSFANFLALSNSAENHHRIRRLKDSLTSTNYDYGLWPKEDSCGGTIHKLLKDGVRKEDVTKALRKQKVEIVLTAHPTEVNRRTMLRKHNHIKNLLEQLDNESISNYEKRRLDEELHIEISGIWNSDDLRRSKPTPVDEAKQGLAIVEHVLWHAVPNFIRKLDDISRNELGSSLPLTVAPLKIASWMGGDRDGNPNVTPEITREVSMLSRWMAATLFKSDIAQLRASLSMRKCSPELAKLVSEGSREPYRELLRGVENRLQATIDWTASNITSSGPADGVNHSAKKDASSAQPLKKSASLMEPLLAIHRSLVSIGLTDVANGALMDTIRRVASFGLSLMPLDIRQESTRHTEALNFITKHLGVGSYAEWDEETRRKWLQVELDNKRPLLSKNFDLQAAGFSANAIDTLRTFQLAAELGPESLGAYVISQCQQASDILAVLLLQQDAGVAPALRVVPLFETLDDLERSSATVDSLFGMKVYRDRIGGKQEIMVGYSDSAKDAGRLAASWAQYNAQVLMSDIAKKYNIEVTFFHGKGGTVGRGGNPALYYAILAHPPDTVQGRFRITEQGEMITQNFGQQATAERTLDLFTAGVLAEGFTERPSLKKEWVESMERLSDISCEAYRQVVRGEERFVPYFRSATPELELSGLNVGSRPAKRNPKGGVDSLRAIPWVFAWTQTRLNLPTWLGVGEALSSELKRDPSNVKDMYANWPWFRTLIDLLEMILVKSEIKIAENYDTQLITDEPSRQLGRELRDKMKLTTDSVMAVSGHPFLQSNNPLLIKSLAVRNPYVDPLNIIQAELLARLRSDKKISEEDRKLLQDALLVTINGIANGMRNSG